MNGKQAKKVRKEYRKSLNLINEKLAEQNLGKLHATQNKR